MYIYLPDTSSLTKLIISPGIPMISKQIDVSTPFMCTIKWGSLSTTNKEIHCYDKLV